MDASQSQSPHSSAPGLTQGVSLIRGTGIVSSLTLLSRIFGFVRDLLTAQLFGASALADAFFVAFRIPNLMRSLIAEGALTSAFIPVFTEEVSKGQTYARSTIRSVTGLLLVLTSGLSGLGLIYAPEIVSVFAPGFGQGSTQQELCVTLTRIMFPLIMCVSLVAMLNGALNTVNIFGAAAWAQVWMNVVLIIGATIAFWYEKQAAIYILAWSVIVGGLVQIFVQLPALRRAGFSIVPSLKIFTPATRQILLLMAPAIVGATIYQLQIFTNTLLASLLLPGSVSWLYYADRLTQLPVGIFSIALASVLLPALSRASINDESSSFSRNLINSLRYTSFIILPIAIGLAVCAEPLVTLLLQRGAFSSEASHKTALAIQAYTLGIWCMSCHSMVVRAFIARKDTSTPTLLGACTLLMTVLLSLIFMGPPVAIQTGWFFGFVVRVQTIIGNIIPLLHLQHAGLALASSFASLFSLCAISIILQRSTPIEWKPFFLASLKTLLASLGMAVMMRFLLAQASSPIIGLAFAIPVGAFSFLVISAVLKTVELSETIALMKKFCAGYVK